jgi:hypothetical protein
VAQATMVKKQGLLCRDMDDNGLGLIALILVAVVGLVVLLGVVAGGYYATDGAVTATVTGKDCGSITSSTGSVDIRTGFPVPGIPHTIPDMPRDKCQLVQAGNFVQYHLRSERTSIWASEGGACIWDTEFGPNGCNRNRD